jgi:PPOX class probable F420-dependent enzyme
MELSTALDYARPRRQSVLTTLRGNGRPQLSNVMHHVSEDGLIRISVTADRAKYRNVLREPWAALHVTQEDFWGYAVIEGLVTLSDVAQSPDDAAVAELVTLYRHLLGEHDDWDEYRAAMVKDQRVVMRIHPERAYGMVP